ncbi:MAG: hypothetical protein IJU29_07540, partial [Oscillospiraceae bacterium]|nr:hypothetical protein [Oscillospiraceae bacterium]
FLASWKGLEPPACRLGVPHEASAPVQADAQKALENQGFFEIKSQSRTKQIKLNKGQISWSH